MSPPFSIVVATNNDDVLRLNLLSSPDVQAGKLSVIAVKNRPAAGTAYNEGLDGLKGLPFVAFIHQDVYLPAGWSEKVTAAITQIELTTPNWGVIGVWGRRADGQYSGRVWCSGSDHEYVALPGIEPAASVDEVVLIVNNRHDLRFDEALPGFHLYSTDIMLQAKAKGLSNFVITAPVVHNSRCNPNPLDSHYFAAYRYMRRKWSSQLPLQTCVVDVTRSGWPLYKQWLRNEVAHRRGRVKPRPSRADPHLIADRLGYGQA